VLPRERFRAYLSRGVGAPPFAVDATAFVAGTGHTTADRLFGDPNLFVRSFVEVMAVSGLDSFLVSVPDGIVRTVMEGRDPATDPAVGTFREGLQRLRATVEDRVALAVLLPGPLTLGRAAAPDATTDRLEEAVAASLRLHEYLDATAFDAVGVFELEATPEHQLADLADAVSTLWNVARYYAVPSLMVAARGCPELGAIGADAVVVWTGSAPDELLTAGAPRVGVPIADATLLPDLPPGGFFTWPGPLPTTLDVPGIRNLVELVSTRSRGAG
jgi:hypothetical protein